MGQNSSEWGGMSGPDSLQVTSNGSLLNSCNSCLHHAEEATEIRRNQEKSFVGAASGPGGKRDYAEQACRVDPGTCIGAFSGRFASRGRVSGGAENSKLPSKSVWR